MRNSVGAVMMVILLAGVTGCGSLMHPKAGGFLQEAKGSNGIETQINLTNMIEASIKSIHGQKDYEAGFDTLHNQLYALKKAGCQVSQEQAKTLAYGKASTLKREVGTIFHRLWKIRDDQALRDVHLDLLAKRVEEFREALQEVRG